jgi:polysaccharide deacetylase 2 family uncharacterized protein YibQ
MGLLDRFKRKPPDDDDDDIKDAVDDEESDEAPDAEDADDHADVAEALAAQSGDADGPPADSSADGGDGGDTDDIRAAVAASLDDMEAHAFEHEEDEAPGGGGLAARLGRRVPGGRAGLIGVAVGAFLLVAGLTAGVSWMIVGGDDTAADEREGVVVGMALPPPGGLTPPPGGGLNAIGVGAGSEMAAAQDAGIDVESGTGDSADSAVPNPDDETVEAEGLNAFAVETGAARQAGTDITVAMTTSAAFDIMLDRAEETALPEAPDEALLERVDGGILVPKIADGRTAFEVYARPADPPAGVPRIAIVVTGLGHSRAATEAAIRKLPGTVTLSFDVYAAGIGGWLNEAWAHGHEVMLSLPMESERFPNEDAGPLALRTTLSPEANRRRLNAVMGRFRGYIGLRTSMGSKFMASEAHIKPVLETLKSRGLMILESDRHPGSLVPRLATELGLARAFTDVELDISPSRAAVSAKLIELEAVARQRGAAIGLTAALPSALEVVDGWIAEAESRGFAVVPVSNIAGARRSGT